MPAYVRATAFTPVFTKNGTRYVYARHGKKSLHTQSIYPMNQPQQQQPQQQQQQRNPTFTPPPPASLNGGLYTGEPFRQGAPWANVPITPDAGVYNFTNLPANAPKLAKYMVPSGGLRPGNNTPMLPAEFTRSRPNGLNSICIPNAAADGPPRTPPCAGSAHGRGGGYSYLL